MSVFTPAQDDLASAIRTLCGPLLQIDPCDPAIYDDGVIIRSHVDNPNPRRLRRAGYRVCASGTRSCLVQPPRSDPPMRRREPLPPMVDAAVRAVSPTGGRAARRHPADVTADRLTDQVTAWADKFDGSERDAIGEIIHALREIAEGKR